MATIIVSIKRYSSGEELQTLLKGTKQFDR